MLKIVVESAIVLATATLVVWMFRPTPIDYKQLVLGKNVIVTGASSGIGEQLAYEYARHGANVLVTARRKELLEKVVTRCKEINPKGKFVYVVSDMAKYEESSVKVIQSAVSKLGGIDHLFLNHAFMTSPVKWVDTNQPLETLKKFIDINLMAFVHLTHNALPYLRNSSSARIGVVSSIAGQSISPYMASYSASKFALDGFFSSLREELVSEKHPDFAITMCFLGMIETDGVAGFFEALERYGVDTRSLRYLIGEKASPIDTAREMFKALIRGNRNLYYPDSLIGLKWIVALRHIAPDLMEIMNRFILKYGIA